VRGNKEGTDFLIELTLERARSLVSLCRDRPECGCPIRASGHGSSQQSPRSLSQQAPSLVPQTRKSPSLRVTGCSCGMWSNAGSCLPACLVRFYFVYGFMLLVYLILVVVSVCTTIVAVYFVLNAENYHWQASRIASPSSSSSVLPRSSLLSFAAIDAQLLYAAPSPLVCITNGEGQECDQI
jgi:hypothetical protein